MQKSTSEQSNRFKLNVMSSLEREEEVTTKKKTAGRSSLHSIPPVNLKDIFNCKPEESKKVEAVVEQSENLCDVLCNSYKFVVNYGVFEANFEWMPFEVRKLSRHYRVNEFKIHSEKLCKRFVESNGAKVSETLD